MSTKNKTLSDLRGAFKRALPNGCVCAICNRPARLRKEHINGGIVRALEWIYAQKKWVNVQEEAPDWIKRDRAYNKPKYWGLVKRVDQGGSKVFYKLSKKGKKFLKGKLSVVKYKLVYNDKVFGESDTLMHVEECRKQKNYKRKATTAK